MGGKATTSVVGGPAGGARKPGPSGNRTAQDHCRARFRRTLLNGDIWTNFRFAGLTSLRPRAAHLVLTPTPPEKPHADFHLEDGRVRRGGGDDLTYCGIAVINPALFDGSPDGAFSLTKLLFKAAADRVLEGEVFEGSWIDIGTPDQLERVRRETL